MATLQHDSITSRLPLWPDWTTDWRAEGRSTGTEGTEEPTMTTGIRSTQQLICKDCRHPSSRHTSADRNACMFLPKGDLHGDICGCTTRQVAENVVRVTEETRTTEESAAEPELQIDGLFTCPACGSDKPGHLLTVLSSGICPKTRTATPPPPSEQTSESETPVLPGQTREFIPVSISDGKLPYLLTVTEDELESLDHLIYLATRGKLGWERFNDSLLENLRALHAKIGEIHCFDKG